MGDRAVRNLLPLLACLAPVPIAGAALTLAPAAAAQTAEPIAPVLAHQRRAADRDRDEWRHPAETLAFFRVRPGMTVVDFTPGGGWWTRVLVPYLGESGRYIGLNPAVPAGSPMAQYYGNTATTFPPKAAEWTGVPASRILAYNTDGVPPELKGQVDRVLVFRAMHNLFRTGMLHGELTAIHALLKPDGMLGIEQHRAKASAPAAYTNGSRGYMREKDVIALVEAYGFELVGKSEVNANAKDPANHPEGVWELPPNSRTKREELKTIGESDRMTLLFRKRP